MYNLTGMQRLSFYIDKITNSIEHATTGKKFDTQVLLLKSLDLKAIIKKDGWHFDWKAESKNKGRQLFKLVIRGNDCIQGLLSFQPMENYIEMHLIEAAPHNYGSSKKYIGVPGNLVAFACKRSFELGFDGFVVFTAKTRLIQHYIDTLGAELIFKHRMRISGNASKNLVNLYFKNGGYDG